MSKADIKKRAQPGLNQQNWHFAVNGQVGPADFVFDSGAPSGMGQSGVWDSLDWLNSNEAEESLADVGYWRRDRLGDRYYCVSGVSAAAGALAHAIPI